MCNTQAFILSMLHHTWSFVPQRGSRLPVSCHLLILVLYGIKLFRIERGPILDGKTLTITNFQIVPARMKSKYPDPNFSPSFKSENLTARSSSGMSCGSGFFNLHRRPGFSEISILFLF